MKEMIPETDKPSNAPSAYATEAPSGNSCHSGETYYPLSLQGTPITVTNLTERIAELAVEFIDSPLRDRVIKSSKQLESAKKEHNENVKALNNLASQLTEAVKQANKEGTTRVALAVGDKVIIWLHGLPAVYAPTQVKENRG